MAVTAGQAGHALTGVTTVGEGAAMTGTGFIGTTEVALTAGQLTSIQTAQLGVTGAMQQGALNATLGQGLAAATSSWGGLMAAGLAVNLAMTGIAEMMAPDPSTDSDQESSYMFNGAEQNVIEGDPVPVLYGHLRIPGQPISFDSISSSYLSLIHI